MVNRSHRNPSRLCRRLALVNAFTIALLLVGMATVSDAALAARAEYIRLSTSATEIYEGDAIVLEIEHTGLADPLDLTSLKLVGRIRRETAGTRIAVVGGKVVEIRLRRIEMVPNRKGIVVIGPLRAGAVQSNSISVRVLADRQVQWQPSAEDINARMRVSTLSPYVQQQFLLDIELSHRYQLVSEQFELPDLSGMRVIERYAARRPAIDTDGMRRVTWRFLLSLDASGPRQIGPFRAHGTMVKSRRERGNFDVTTDPVTLQVQPARTEGWWLPADSLTLTEHWSTDKRTLSAGDETIRTLHVSATGVTAGQIPDLVMPPARGLKVSRIDQARQTETFDTYTVATAKFRYRVQAMSPVPVFPDTIRLDWWDTREDRARTAILPAQRIEIGMPDREALLKVFDQQESTMARLTGQLAATGLRPWLLPVSILVLLASLLLALVRLQRRAARETVLPEL